MTLREAIEYARRDHRDILLAGHWQTEVDGHEVFTFIYSHSRIPEWLGREYRLQLFVDGKPSVGAIIP